MKKLIQGILEFRKNHRDNYIAKVKDLILTQSPDALLIACSDSRVVPNTFASTDPGDLFVVRNVGNLVPVCCGENDHADQKDVAEASAIEFAVNVLNVSDIIVCGHSECGAMAAIVAGRDELDLPHLKEWLQHGEEAHKNILEGKILDPNMSMVNQTSQANVLLQLEHLKTYPSVRERVESGKLGLHGWWFDIKYADIYTYQDESGRFELLS